MKGARSTKQHIVHCSIILQRYRIITFLQLEDRYSITSSIFLSGGKTG